MAGARGFVMSIIGLTLLEAFLTSKTAPAGLAGGAKLAAGGLGRWLDPTIPLIPNVAHITTTGASYATTAPAAGPSETA